MFPSYGGFERQILFIKPDEGGNINGYFIILDELGSESQQHQINWMLHSRGTANISTDYQSFTVTVPSYTTVDNISLNVRFLDKVDTIEEGIGYFLPVHYREPYPYNDLETAEIKVNYDGSRTPLFAAVLYPKNDSDLTQSFPQIQEKSSGLKQIGDTDYLFYTKDPTIVQTTTPNLSFTGKLFFLRQNRTDPSQLEYYYLQAAQQFEYNTTTYFSSSHSLEYILCTYLNSTQISGAFKNENEITSTISIFCPFNVSVVQLDGLNISFSKVDSVVTFSASGSHSFIISSYNQPNSSEFDSLREIIPPRTKPTPTEWEFKEGLIKNLTHPYILFNNTELAQLRVKIQDTTKPWNMWYNSYISGVDSILSWNVSTIDPETRYYYVYKLALKFVVDGSGSYLNKIKEFLQDLPSVTSYSQDLARAYAVQAYAMAYDIIYSNLSSSEQIAFFQSLYEHAKPLMEMDLYPDNNHRVVDAGALGIAGLALKEDAFINKAIDTILIYYYTKNPVDGGSYEGYSYNAFAMDEMIAFAVSLKRLGGYNFFEDPQMIATFDFIANTLGPLCMPSLFEDCAFSTRMQEILLVAAAQMNATHPLKAQNYQYIWEKTQNNTQFPGAATYSYLKGGRASFRRITCYSVNESIPAVPISFKKEVWKESAMAFLRSSEDSNALFLSFSCKNYIQSHTHYDENGFEIWAYGAYLVNNPGYPGYGNTHHDWTIETEASNTLLIGGSGQRQDYGEGLVRSISSPYFSMVAGQALHIYDDFGSFAYNSELYISIISSFIIIGVCFALYFWILKSRNTAEQGKEGEISSRTLPQTRYALLKLAFFHPNQTQDLLYAQNAYDTDGKFLNRVIFLLISMLMTIIFIVLILDMKTIIDYHSQYYESDYSWIFEILPIIELTIILGGALFTFIGGFLLIKFYGRLNRTFVSTMIDTQSLGITRQKMDSVIRMSLIWQSIFLILSAILLYFTIVQSFKVGIHHIFIGLGSLNMTYYEVLSFLQTILRTFGLILVFEIPFFIGTIKIFSYGIDRVTEGTVPQKSAWKIPILSFLLIILIFLSIIALLFIGVKLGFSAISIEGTTLG